VVVTINNKHVPGRVRRNAGWVGEGSANARAVGKRGDSVPRKIAHQPIGGHFAQAVVEGVRNKHGAAAVNRDTAGVEKGGACAGAVNKTTRARAPYKS
jgi:hypothetical protein